MRSKINNIVNTIVYFHRTPYTYNRDMLHNQLDSAQSMLSNALKVDSLLDTEYFLGEIIELAQNY